MDVDVFAKVRDELLERVEAADWPLVLVADLGILDGPTPWTVAIEAGTPVELIAMFRALVDMESEELTNE